MTATKLPGRNWLRMAPADFDRDAPDAVDHPVPAVPDECGTAPLFGEDPAAVRTPDARMPAATFPEQADTLF
ncbi:hypothetical protein [Streptomyces sp. NPDC048584]|uniref:hypothetical protein n=1 Tax=Streptomyces sp. NPDC048584 TaxID=3365573 RepID=UPI003716E0D7